MRRIALVICILFLSACSRAITASPLPQVEHFGNAPVPNARAYRTVFNFNGPNGKNPISGLITVKGVLYGTASGGRYGPGTVYEIKSGVEKIIHSFGKTSDGSTPGDSELAYINGELYGVTTYGGKYSGGTVYKITASGKEQIVYSFKASFVTPVDGNAPQGNVVAVDGNLYGTTSEGGKYDEGIVYRLSPAGDEKILYSFKGGTDGATPLGTLTAVGHTLYGTTQSGGIRGTIFKISTSGQEKVIHTFGKSVNDGGTPNGGLTYLNGRLYGTTQYQGLYNDGVVFAIGIPGKYQVLHPFAGNPDGANPTHVSLTNVHGTLYGTTVVGGTEWGTVFKITPDGTESIVHNFTNGSGGQNPYGDVALLNGRLYGTTYIGGSGNNLGTVYSLLP